MVAGRIARLQGDSDTAVIHFELVTSLAEYDPRPWMERSEMALASGDHNAARNHAHRATVVAPADPRVFLAQARLFIALGELDAALETVELALLRDAERRETVHLRAHVRDLIEQASQATEKWD